MFFFLRKRRDLDKTRMKRDEEDILSIISTINNMVNPFSSDRHELLQIASGVIATEDTSNDMDCLEKVGTKKSEEFINNNILSDNPDIFSKISQVKLHTFTNMHKVLKTKNKKGELVAVKNTKNLFAKLILLARSRDVDMKEVLQYPLRPFPLPFSKPDGALVKGTKSALLEVLERAVDNPLVTAVDNGGALLIDAMALFQSMKIKVKTFGELAVHVLDGIVSLGHSFGCQRVDFVGDRYPKISIKDLERQNRAAGGTQMIRISNAKQPVPRQWKKFLSAGQNKEEIMKFLFQHWSTLSSEKFNGKLVYLTHENECHRFQATASTLSITEVPELESDHEEADTRLLLHAHHASTNHQDIVIRSPDTDVFVIAVYAKESITKNLFFATGTLNKKRIINVNAVNAKWKPIAKALPGLHAFTGTIFLYCFL